MHLLYEIMYGTSQVDNLVLIELSQSVEIMYSAFRPKYMIYNIGLKKELIFFNAKQSENKHSWDCSKRQNRIINHTHSKFLFCGILFIELRSKTLEKAETSKDSSLCRFNKAENIEILSCGRQAACN